MGMDKIEDLKRDYNKNRQKIEDDKDLLVSERKKSYQQIESIEDTLRYYLRDTDTEDGMLLHEGLKLIHEAVDEIDDEERRQRRKLDNQLDDLDYEYEYELRKIST